ncbi:hypothetical protein EVAR_9015_1 [Eumeta japonica]|uniref:Uncharacterized protein n=1 Tax=Eumeta variegata TaxID=151549 RepID=A0A4C1TVV0_EUMVA|nr:hypothetical protein EVAR_9015_1 [Eumeta japonica]
MHSFYGTPATSFVYVTWHSAGRRRGGRGRPACGVAGRAALRREIGDGRAARRHRRASPENDISSGRRATQPNSGVFARSLTSGRRATSGLFISEAQHLHFRLIYLLFRDPLPPPGPARAPPVPPHASDE